MPSGPFESYEAMEHQVFNRIRDNNGMVLFAIHAKEARDGTEQDEDFAGQVGFLNGSTTDAATEIGL